MIRRPFQPLAALKWLAVLVPMAAVIGSASAFFLWSLDALTRVRFAHPWLLWLLPLGGLAVGWLYHITEKPRPAETTCSSMRSTSPAPACRGGWLR